MAGTAGHSGRPRGRQDARKIAFRERLRRYMSARKVDPHYWMVQLLADPEASTDHKLQAAKELAQYLEPKLRAIELSGDADNPLHHLHELPAGQLNARITQLLRACGYAGDHAALPEGEA